MRGKEIKKERKNHENVCGMLAFQHLQYTSVFQDIPKQIVLFLKTNYEQNGLSAAFPRRSGGENGCFSLFAGPGRFLRRG
jgi:hypothetical protein